MALHFLLLTIEIRQTALNIHNSHVDRFGSVIDHSATTQRSLVPKFIVINRDSLTFAIARRAH
jgi:hypothetical protein